MSKKIGIDICHFVRIREMDKSNCIKAKYLCYAGWNIRGGDTLILEINEEMENKIIQLNKSKEWGSRPRQRHRVYDVDGKAPALYTRDNTVKVIQHSRVRKLTPLECRRLQTIPDWYKMDCVSKTAQYKALGNGWTVEVIKHILSYLNK